jgi:hypothetical protein
MNHSRVELCEMKLIQGKGSDEQIAFQGMIILIDFSEVKLKLRALLNGHTILVADADKKEVGTKLSEEWQNIPLPDAKTEAHFELISTDKSEAQKLSNSLVIEALSDQLQSLKSSQMQHTHHDGIFWSAFEKLGQLVYNLATLNFLSGRVPSADRLEENEVDFIKVNNTLQLAAWRDRMVMTLPYDQNLFEPDSLFASPAIHEEDLKLFFQLIQTLETLTNEVDVLLKKITDIYEYLTNSLLSQDRIK